MINNCPTTDVTATCEKPSARDYSYFLSAARIETGIDLALRVVAQIEAGRSNPLIPDLIDKSFNYTLFEKHIPVSNACVGFDTEKFGGLKDLGTEWEDHKVLDVAKVQAVIDETGKLPIGVDADAFNAATGQNLTVAEQGGDSGKPSAGAGNDGKPDAGAGGDGRPSAGASNSGKPSAGASDGDKPSTGAGGGSKPSAGAVGGGIQSSGVSLHVIAGCRGMRNVMTMLIVTGNVFMFL